MVCDEDLETYCCQFLAAQSADKLRPHFGRFRSRLEEQGVTAIRVPWVCAELDLLVLQAAVRENRPLPRAVRSEISSKAHALRNSLQIRPFKP